MMTEKIKLEDKEYEIDDLTDVAKATLIPLQFATNRLQELNNMQAVLQRAKNSYLKSFKKEILSDKAGLIFQDD
jgi:hypothetical protein